MSDNKIVVIGGINMDLVISAERLPEPGETVLGTSFTTYPGGKGANQAVAAASMGAAVRLIGRVGQDLFGTQLLASLGESGVDVVGVATDPDATSGIAVIYLDPNGQNRIVQVLGANVTCGDAEVDRAKHALAGASAVMLQLEVPVSVSLEVAREAKRMGTLVVLDPSPPIGFPEELYRLCDYITPNETEAEALVGFPVVDVPSARRATGEIVTRGVANVVIKMGDRGACFRCGSEEGHLPAFTVPVVDTVGAGDAFNGALTVALVEGRSLLEAVGWANAAGALAVTKHGAQDAMPARGEVEELLRHLAAPSG